MSQTGYTIDYVAQELQVVQLFTAPYESSDGRTQSMLYCLATDKAVYKYVHTAGGWVRLSMIVVPQPIYDSKKRRQNNDEAPF